MSTILNCCFQRNEKDANSIYSGALLMRDNFQVLIPYNLQFFAPDGEGGEKTEQPTSKKLSDARKEGKVAKSKEIVNGVSLLGFFFCLRVFTSFAGIRLEEIFAWIYAIIPDVATMNGGLTIQAFHIIFKEDNAENMDNLFLLNNLSRFIG